MRIYRVKTEYVDKFSNDPMWAEAPFLTDEQYSWLTEEWGDISGMVEAITVSRYAFEDIRAAADCPDEDVVDAAVNMLGEWCAEYDPQNWNGEYYDADGLRIFPRYIGEELAGYEAR
jgi:hypothetical protein